MKRSKKSNFCRQFIFSYFISLIIPLFIITIAYFQVVKIIEEDSYASWLTILENCKKNIEINIEEVDEMIIQMSYDWAITMAANMDEIVPGSQELYKLYQADKSVSSYINTNRFKDSFYIFLKKNNFIISPIHTYTDLPFYYKYHLSFDGMTYNEWYDLVLNQKHKKTVLPIKSVKQDETTKNVVTYLQSIPVDAYEEPMGTIMFLFEEEDLLSLFKESDSLKGGIFCIVDSNGNLLCSNNKKIDFSNLYNNISDEKSGHFVSKINHKKMMVSYTTSEKTGWTFFSLMPTDVTMRKVESIRRFLVIILALAAIIGIVLAVVFARRNAKPVSNIYIMLKNYYEENEDTIDGEYKFISKGIQRLINMNNDLNESFSNQIVIMRQIFFDRLFKGEFIIEKELNSMKNYIGFVSDYDYYIVIIISFAYYDEILDSEILQKVALVNTAIEDIVKNDFDGKTCSHSINQSNLALILTFDSEKVEDRKLKTNELIVSLKNKLFKTFQIDIILGVGDFVDSLINVEKSFRQAQNCIQYAQLKNIHNEAIYYTNIQRKDTGFIYSASFENNIMNQVKIGNHKEVEKSLSNVFEENFISNSIRPQMQYLLINNICGTLIKLINEVELPEKEQKKILQSVDLIRRIDVIDAFKLVKSNILEICDLIDLNRISHNEKMINKIKDYIFNNYMDSNLTVANVAEEFNLSRSYFSQFFKQETGETFSSFLENYRIKKACDFIEDRDIALQKISNIVGYNSAYTFRRAFKRVTGVLPSHFKNAKEQKTNFII